MNKYLVYLAVLITSCCFVSSADSKELVREFKGSGNKTTAEFEVTAPWILDWRVTSEFQGGMGLQVDLVDSHSGEYLGKVVLTRWVSNGVRLFDESGRFSFKVSASFADWTLRVEKLSRQEALAYTPK